MEGRAEVTWQMNGVYLHGEVERLCEYDICYPTDYKDFKSEVRSVLYDFASGKKFRKHLFLDGIFPCIVDEKYECTAYLWFDEEYINDYCAQKGLIVLNTDEEAREYARKCYSERVPCL